MDVTKMFKPIWAPFKRNVLQTHQEYYNKALIPYLSQKNLNKIVHTSLKLVWCQETKSINDTNT